MRGEGNEGRARPLTPASPAERSSPLVLCVPKHTYYSQIQSRDDFVSLESIQLTFKLCDLKYLLYFRGPMSAKCSPFSHAGLARALF